MRQGRSTQNGIEPKKLGLWGVWFLIVCLELTWFRGTFSFDLGSVRHAQNPPYPSEFRQQMIELVNADCTHLRHKGRSTTTSAGLLGF